MPCLICCDDSGNLKIIYCKKQKCQEANDGACVDCYKNYFTHTAYEAKCMYCDTPWSVIELYKNLDRKWIYHEFRANRGKRLMDQEEARLPDTQKYLAPFRNRAAARKLYAVLTQTNERVNSPDFHDLKTAIENFLKKKFGDSQWWSHILSCGDSLFRDYWYNTGERRRYELKNHFQEATLYFTWYSPSIIKDKKRTYQLEDFFERYSDPISSQHLTIHLIAYYYLFLDAESVLTNIVADYRRSLQHHAEAEIKRTEGLVRQTREDPNFMEGNGPPVPVATMIVSSIGDTIGEDNPPVHMLRCDKECEGYVYADGVCGVCGNRICTKCQKDYTEAHKCDPDDLKTLSMIRCSTTKCPKCAMPISIVDGCSQMWCILCHTFFDYKTGKIDTGKFKHNPHYFEWLDKQKKKGVEQSVGNWPGNAYANQVGAFDAYPYQRIVNMVTQFCNFFGQQIDDIVTSNYYQNRNTLIKRYLRIRFLLGEITKKQWMNYLVQLEDELEFRSNLFDIYQMAVNSANNLRDELTSKNNITTTEQNYLDFFEQIRTLSELIYDSMEEVTQIKGNVGVSVKYKSSEPIHTKLLDGKRKSIFLIEHKDYLKLHLSFDRESANY